ncbi:MAG: hypothetical protein ABSG76_01375 [Xanthobacteraceae bacterium]
MNANVPFASADLRVSACYDLLGRALRPGLIGLPSPHAVDEYARQYVKSHLRVVLPRRGSEITEECAETLLESFLKAISLDDRKNRKLLSAGGVSFTFSCLVYGIVGDATVLTGLQQHLLLEICAIAAEHRPLPVLRWTDFVRSNLGDLDRIRTIMRSCIYSKMLLSERLADAVESLTKQLGLPDVVRVLAIGSSGTVRDALIGLHQVNRFREIEVFLTRPTFGIPFDEGSGFEVEIVPEADVISGAAGKFHLIVMGCGVIGKTETNRIEVVNWSQDISLAKRMRERGVPLIVVGGLYKIWPQSFYQERKASAVRMLSHSPAESDAILTERDIDWLVTEHEPVNLREGQRPYWLEFLFGTRSLDVHAMLALCANKKSGTDELLIHSLFADTIIDDVAKRLDSLDMPLDTSLDKPVGRIDMAAPAVSDLRAGENVEQRQTKIGAFRPGVPGHERVEEGANPAYGLFKLGFLLMIVGLPLWLAFLGVEYMRFALAASIVVAIGANILMLGVLGGRRGEAADQIQS